MTWAPKKLYWEKNKIPLTLDEYIIHDYTRTKHYHKSNIKIVNDSMSALIRKIGIEKNLLNDSWKFVWITKYNIVFIHIYIEKIFLF